MKQVAWKFAFILLTAVVILQGCKKGENDPFLSLRSRDTRITGEWELIKMENTSYSKNNSGSPQYSFTRTASFNGTLLTFIEKTDFDDPDYEDKDTTYSQSYSRVIVIKKDGNFNQTTIEDGITQKVLDNWWWLNDKKKKTRIAFENDANSFEVDRLKNNELILKHDFAYNNTDSLGVNDKLSYATVMTFKKN
jgi:hypothetical protein